MSDMDCAPRERTTKLTLLDAPLVPSRDAPAATAPIATPLKAANIHHLLQRSSTDVGNSDGLPLHVRTVMWCIV